MTQIDDPVGYRFSRWDDDGLTLFRYRIANTGAPYLLREKWDTTANTWKMMGSKKLAENLRLLTISYNDADDIPLTVKEGPVTARFTLVGTYQRMENVTPKEITFDVKPISQ